MLGLAHKRLQQGNALILLVGLIAVLAIGIGGYMFLDKAEIFDGTNLGLQNENEATPLDQDAKNENQNDDEIQKPVIDDNWLIHQDDELGLRIEYPSLSEFTVHDEVDHNNLQQSIIEYLNIIYKINNSHPTALVDGFRVNIHFLEASQDKSFNDFVYNLNESYEVPMPDLAEIKIGDNTGLIGERIRLGDEKHIKIFIDYSDDVYLMVDAFISKNNQQNYQPMVDRIINSLTFAK